MTQIRNRIRSSDEPGDIPTTSQLVLGELAINTYDGKLYAKKSVSSVESIVEIGGGGGGYTLPIASAAVLGGIKVGANLSIDGAGVLSATGGSAVWGSITGNILTQTDLVSSLATKEPTITAGTTAQYYRGDKSWQTHDKASVGLSAVENTALSTWAGSTNVTTLGTITSGTWHGSVISSTYGGTGVNNAGRTLTISTNSGTVSFTGAGTTLTVAATGSISGTNTGDQTSVSGSAGSVVNAVTFNNAGSGAVSGSTYNGSSAVTVSYNSIGASPAAGSASLTTTGNVTAGTWSATLGAISGSSLTSLNASNLSTGTVATARLGTGTADSTTYLRGDGTWATVSGGTTITVSTTAPASPVVGQLWLDTN